MNQPRYLKFVRFSLVPDYLRLGWMTLIPNAPTHHHWYGVEMAWLCDCKVRVGDEVRS